MFPAKSIKLSDGDESAFLCHLLQGHRAVFQFLLDQLSAFAVDPVLRIHPEIPLKTTVECFARQVDKIGEVRHPEQFIHVFQHFLLEVDSFAESE
jgi:hypothetical protein